MEQAAKETIGGGKRQRTSTTGADGSRGVRHGSNHCVAILRKRARKVPNAGPQKLQCDVQGESAKGLRPLTPAMLTKLLRSRLRIRLCIRIGPAVWMTPLRCMRKRRSNDGCGSRGRRCNLRSVSYRHLRNERVLKAGAYNGGRDWRSPPSLTRCAKAS